MAKMTATKQVKKVNPSALVRMYRHGLGDCFLLRFPRSDRVGTFNVLIDCGLITVATGPKDRMQEVVADIGKTCHGHLDLVIMTHEHWDHASAFSKQQVQEAFDQLTIDEVWYAWTEDPEDALGKKLRGERAAKVKALQIATVALRDSGSDVGIQRADRLASILQFFGGESIADLQPLAADGDGVGKTRAAFDYLAKRSDVAVRYCRPSDSPVAFEGVDGIRVYVLGPPQDEGLIKRSVPTKKGKEVYEFTSELAIDESLASAFVRMSDPAFEEGGKDCPFDASLGFSVQGSNRPTPAKLATLMLECWDHPDQRWRRIELDWTASAEALALNLDNHTNNTCLVVAFELVKTGRVLLFAADAQVGNWLSWQDTKWSVKSGDKTERVTGPELLGRTVFYKVGHHGSHNATLRALGLEQMTSNDLVAFVPVFKAEAEKNRWMAMPFEPLMQRLREKTGGRVILSDRDAQAPTAEDLDALSSKQQKAFLKSLAVKDLYFEYKFEL